MSAQERLPPNLRAGLWSLCGFTTLGLLLEALHGFKLGLYLDVEHETRRLLWRLAHAHGALLGLLNVVYALAERAFPALADALAGRALLAALLLMPSGFLLGGAFARGGDPGAGVVLAAAGGVALLFGLLRLALKAR
ncbi:MAG: hypothetical protein EOO73_17370 [Myxococcales bacterium]|nr:MAG: hypothetical protein EOO73_17370 [Myxococcales bacterium]